MKKAVKKAENKKDTKKNKGGEGAEGGAGGGEDDEHESMTSSKKEKITKITSRKDSFLDDDEEEETEEVDDNNDDDEEEEDKEKKKVPKVQIHSKTKKIMKTEDSVPKVPIHAKTKKIMKKEDSLDDVLKCFWHGSKYGKSDGWPRETILYYQLRLEYDDMEETVQLLSLPSPTWSKISNDSGKLHAEEILLGRLRSELFKRPNANCKLKCVKLDIFLSYSPCNSEEHACARKLVSFKRFVETNFGAEVILSIKIANFYNLNLTDNIKGLCLLINSGVHLSVFSGDKDWEMFYNDVTPKNDLENQIISNNYTNERQQREEVDVMILQRLKNIAPYFAETGMIPPKFEDRYFCAVPAHFTQSEVRILTAEYYRRQMENLKNA